jgi:hypothetical protein
LTIDQGCQHAGIKTSWIMEQDRYPRAERNWPKRRQFVLYDSWEERGERISVHPDAAVLMELPGDAKWQILGLLEFDRSTETHKELLDKMPGYRRLLLGRDKSYRKPWSQIDPRQDRDVPRILFVCPSKERQSNIARTFGPTPIAPFLRVAVASALTPESVIHEPVWCDTAL